MVSALTRKLLRDVATLRGQVITIAMVVACGISSYVTLQSAYDSLLYSRDKYYQDYRFADVFASLEAAPRIVAEELVQLPGVMRVDARVLEVGLVPIEDSTRPISGTVVGLDATESGSRLNDVHIVSGRGLEPGRTNEILLLDAFARAHAIVPGDSIEVVLNEAMRRFTVVGLAISPEFVMPIAPGQMSYDPKTALVLWADERALASAFQLEGAFNNVTFQLEPGASEADVLARVDAILEPYGGRGTITRAKQMSNYVLEGELKQLQTMAGFVPYLFLFVAALLVNVVLSRLVQLQRSQIATLKAVGYRDLSIGLHYLELVTLIVGVGAVLGVALGSYLGEKMTGMYTGTFFQFPDPSHRLRPTSVMLAISMSFGSALVGAWLSVSQVMRLPPAEAMRPPNPARYRRSLLEVIGLFSLLGPSARMVYRELARRPLRVLLSVVGISFCTALVVVARASWDGIGYLLDVQFHESMREDLTVTLARPMPKRVIRELGRIDGVFAAEGLRGVPVRFRVGSRYRDSTIMGYPPDLTLRRLLDAHAAPQQAPEEGIMLTDKLAEVLGVGIGDQVDVQFREGLWNTARVPVTALVAEPFGLQGHMTARALAHSMRTEQAVNTVLLAVDSAALSDIERRLRDIPAVVGVSSPSDFRRQFDEQSASMILLFTTIITVFAAIIAVGVIYNNARVALSQRARDLASLRILGFTRREIAAILFGEQAITVVAALPFGVLLGRWLSYAMMSTADPENYRFPSIMSELTAIIAVGVTVLSAVFSGLILRRKLYKLDLIGVLKTRE